MESRTLGNSGLQISCIGLGTNYVGGYGLYTDIDEDEGVRLVQRALDLGVTFIDTADIYGFGRSEELVGKAIVGRRDEVVLAPKAGPSKSKTKVHSCGREPLASDIRRARPKAKGPIWVWRGDKAIAAS